MNVFHLEQMPDARCRQILLTPLPNGRNFPPDARGNERGGGGSERVEGSTYTVERDRPRLHRRVLAKQPGTHELEEADVAARHAPEVLRKDLVSA